MPGYMGPTFDAMMPALIRALKDLGGSGRIREINRRIIEIMNLPASVAEFPHGSSSMTEVEYRLTWTRSFLKQTGYIVNPARSIWALTTQGKNAENIDTQEIVRRVRAQQALTADTGRQPDAQDVDPENGGMELPEEIQDWRIKLRNVLLNLEPAAFERLAQLMLRQMGFTQVTVTGRSGDEGIDGTGIIQLGGALSFHMLFQCKRYRDRVSAGAMRDFRGAMQGRADKGIFITTGKFTDAALQEARRPGVPLIDTIDGEELIDKLCELRMGVEPVVSYQIDEAWFADI